MNDPILSNPDIQKLMSTADEGLMRSFVQRWKAANYRPEDVTVGGFSGISSVNTSGVQEGTSFLNSMKAAYLLHGIVGTAQRKIKGALSKADMIYDYQRVLPYSGKTVNVDEWYKKNKDSLSQSMRAAYVAGDLDGLQTEDELYSALAYIGADDAYRKDLEEARGVAGFAGAMTGGLLDPGGWVLTAGVGKLGAVGFGALRQAKNAQLAAAITANAGRATKVATAPGILARVGENVAVGVASNTVQETALHAMDSDRTKEDTISTLATGILFDSLLSAGFAAATRTPIRSRQYAFIERPAEAFTLKDIEADIDAYIKAKAAAKTEATKPVTGEQTELQYPAKGASGEQGTLFPMGKEEQLGLFDTALSEDLAKQVDALLAQADQAKPLTEQVDELMKQAEVDNKLKGQVDQLLLDFNKKREVQAELFTENFSRELSDSVEREIDAVMKQPAPEDFVEGAKALKEYEDFAMEEIAARKAAKTPKVAEAAPEAKAPTADVPPAQPPADVPPAKELNGEGDLTRYDVYELLKPQSATTRKAVDFVDKYGQNVIPWFAPMSKLESTKSTAFKMLMAKLYQKRLPAVGSITGEIKPGVPFERVQATVQRKKQMVDRVLGQSFRRMLSMVDPSLKNKAFELSNLPEELWSKNLHQKATDYFDFVDAIRVANTLKNVADDQKALSSTELVDRGIDILRGARGDAWVDGRISALGFSGKEAQLKAHIAELFDEVLPVSATMRERLRTPPFTPENGKKLSKADRIDSLYQESLGVKLVSNDADKMTMNDFARFWTLITTDAGELSSSPEMFNYYRSVAERADSIGTDEVLAVAERLNAEMKKSNLAGLSDADIDYIAANPLATDNRAYRIANTFRDFFMNHYGGYIPPIAHDNILHFRKANGEFGVRFDARRSVALRTRALEQVELGVTLKDYLVEAGQWDKALKQATEPLLEKYNNLRANKAFGVTVTEFTQKADDPDYGFINGMKAWNTDALRAIENNIVTNHVPAMSRMDNVASKYPEITQGSSKWMEDEKQLLAEGFQHIRQRTGLELESSMRGQDLYKVGAPMARNLMLTGRLFNNTVEVVSAIYATATSPFKGDMKALAAGILTDMEKAAERGIDRGAFINNLEYLNEVSNSLAVRYFNETKYADGLLDGNTSAAGTPEFGVLERIGAVQSGPVGKVIDFAALGSFSQEFGRSIAAHSTLYQVFSKDGLILRMDKAFDDIAAGMNRVEAFTKNGLNNYWGRWASEFLTEQDVREVAKLIKEDVTKEITTPKRFYLDKLFGESSFKVVDLPEQASLAQRQAIENVAMFTNQLITREKMSLPSFLDDITGTSSPLMRLLTFWMRPSSAAFNRMFVGNASKGSKEVAGILLLATATSMAIDVAKAQVNGKGADKLEEIDKNWLTWAMRRGAWVSAFGTGGEKLISFAFPRAGRFGGLLEAAPFGVADMLARSAYSGKKIATGEALSESEANNLWRMGHVVGLPVDTLGARLLGNTGRILGVYGEENNALDLQAMFNNAIGVKERR